MNAFDQTGGVEGASQAEILESLPDSLRELADTVSLDSVLKLAAYFGGTTLHVPTTLRKARILAAVVGKDEAQKICRQYPGLVIYVAKGKTFALRLRNKEILSLYELGTPVRELARQFDLSDRHVKSILNSVK